ncbi:hypothetical protein V6N13_117613 [Hibiscus sabdariffa]|uniref:Membrane-associated kinase regulator 1 n=1 Tax=Hibiscus sabdariffa TaxID=183260 RepID=A0ABR2PB55_9ROSI
METRRKRSSSGEIFSFLSTPNEELDSEFEFGCFTPESPSQDPYRTSPADRIFFNGKLLPHAFPLPSATHVVAGGSSSHGTSRTSSINSKDSLMSSRSNSTNSRSSTCSSARTSSSDNSERRLLYHGKIHACNRASKTVTAQLYGDSQRRQYITAVPVLKREVSRRKNCGVARKDALRGKKQGDHHQEKSATKGRSEPCLRFSRLFLLACRECHAMEPSGKQE